MLLRSANPKGGERFFVGSLMQIDSKAWEEFLEKLAELEKKYLQVLHELDTAQGRLQALEQEQHTEKPRKPTRTTPAEQQVILGTTEPSKLGLTTRLETKSPSLQVSPTGPGWNLLNPNARCGQCGGIIMNATRFCERCGADFGKLTCACGEQVTGSVAFCDHCGRRVQTTGGPDRPPG